MISGRPSVRGPVDPSAPGGRRTVFPGGYGRTSLVVGRNVPRLLRGAGAHVEDETGRRLVDGNMNFATLVLGHAHPEVVSAARSALERGSCLGLAHHADEALGEALVDRIAHAEQVKLTSSGTEAVLLACRLARAITGRELVVGIAGAYHGQSDAAVAIAHGDGARGVTPATRGEVASVPLNDEAALEAVVAAHGDRLAAIILDLLPNHCGLVAVSDAFAVAARRAADRTGALLVFDEVVSFRLAEGGLQSLYPVRPDVTVLGKAIGGGLPMGAILGSAAVMEPFDPFSDAPIAGSGTFSGNPVSAAAGLACLERFGADEIGWIDSLGARLRGRLAAGLPDPWQVRGRGSLARVLVPGAPPWVAHRLWWGAYERGALVTPTGLAAIGTPMTEALVDELADALVGAAREVRGDDIRGD